MIYYQVTESKMFYGQEFLKDELLTPNEVNKWIKKQKNIYAEPFIKSITKMVSVSQKKLDWFFGARFIK